MKEENIIIVKKGEIVKIGGIPCQLLQDTPIYSETYGNPVPLLAASDDIL